MMWRRYFITLTILLLGCNLLAQKSKDSLEFANFYYDALKYLAIDNNEMALKQLERCSELIGDDASTLYLRGKILSGQGKLDEAEKLLQKAYNADTGNHWYLKALAKVFFDKGENEKAFELYTKSLENDPNSEELHLSLAKLYEGNNMYEKALEHYQHYCELRGNPDKELMKCVRLQFELKRFKDAEKSLSILLDKNSSDYKLWILKTDLLQKQKKQDQAKAAFEEMMLKFPDISQVKYAYAEFLFLTEDYSNLRSVLNQIIAEPSLSVSKKIALLNKLLNNSKIVFSDQEIANLIDVLVRVHPESYDVNFIAGSFKLQGGYFQEAATLLANARRQKPNTMKVWLMELGALNSARNYQSMDVVADSAMLLYPTFPEVFYYKGLSSLRLNHYDVALEYLETGNELILDNKQLAIDFKNLEAEIYYNQQKYDLSFNKYEEILVENSENEFIKNNYSFFLAEQNKKLKRAEELILQNLKKRPNDYKYLDTYAWVLFKQKNYSKALKQIELSIQNGGGFSAMVQEHHGEILLALGRTADALRAYEQSLQIDSTNNQLVNKVNSLKQK